MRHRQATSTAPDAEQRYLAAQQLLLERCGVDAESHFVDTHAANGRTHVLTAGSGPPVLMVIGSDAPAAMWAPLMAALDGHTLHAVDLPGHGLTDVMPYDTDTFRRRTTTFVAAVVDALDLGRATVVANSMGGLWSLWTALDRPDEVGRLVLVGCPATVLGTSAPLPMRLATVPVFGALMMRVLPTSPEQAERDLAMTNEDASDLPELPDLMSSMRRLPGYEHMIRAQLGSVARLRGARPEIALGADELAGVTQPVQLIWGRDDPFGSPHVGRRVDDALPDSELHLVPGGHMPWLDDTEAVAGHIMSFLGGPARD